MRRPGAGSDESGGEDRIAMEALPFLAGVKLPANVAPAWSRIVSPGCAAFNAA